MVEKLNLNKHFTPCPFKWSFSLCSANSPSRRRSLLFWRPQSVLMFSQGVGSFHLQVGSDKGKLNRQEMVIFFFWRRKCCLGISGKPMKKTNKRRRNLETQNHSSNPINHIELHVSTWRDEDKSEWFTTYWTGVFHFHCTDLQLKRLPTRLFLILFLWRLMMMRLLKGFLQSGII